MSELTFLVVYMVFFLTVTYITSLGAPDLVSEEFAEQVKAPTCSIGGLDAMIDVIRCIFGSLGVFFKLMSVQTTFKWFGMIIIAPLLVGLLFLILSLIRGGH